MRHRKKNNKLNRSRAQRKALIKALLRAAIIEERITTTPAKAKVLKSHLDRMISLAKTDTLYHRRLCYRWLEDHKLVKRLFTDIAPRFSDINGGFCRIIKTATRKGDGADLAIFELTKVKKEHIKKLREKKHLEHKEEKPKSQIPPKKEKPKRSSFLKGIHRIFKKERDAL